MPTISANASQQITIPAGQRLRFLVGGAGIGLLAGSNGFDGQFALGPSEQMIGPFPSDRVFRVSCTQAVQYQLQAPPFDAFLSSGNAIVSVDASGNQVANGYPVSGAGNKRPTIWFIGDSHTGRNLTGATYTSANQYSSLWGFANHAQVLNGQKFNVLGFAGVGGQTVEQIAARLLTDYGALGQTPDYVCVLAGTNNVGSESAQSLIAKLRTLLWQPIRTLGPRLIVCTLPPVTGATADTMAKTAWINDAIRKEAGTANTIVVDFARAITEQSTGAWRTVSSKALTTDNTHGNTWGAFLMGAQFVRDTANIQSSVAQVTGFGSVHDPLEYLPNPYMAGNNASGTNKYFNQAGAGTASGTGPHGVALKVATGASTTATGTGGVTRLDGLDGTAFQVACSFSAANDRVSIFPSAQNLTNQDFTLSKTFGTRLFVPGELVRPSTPNGFMYRCVNSAPATATGTEPTWPTTLGATVTSGGITWMAVQEMDTAGAEYEFVCDFAFSAISGAVVPSLDITFYDSGYTGLTTAKVRTYPNTQVSAGAATLFQYTGDVNIPAAGWTLNTMYQLKTLPFTIPAGLDHFYPALTIWGDASTTATVLIHRMSLRRIASL